MVVMKQPDDSPMGLGRRSGVRRVNNVPLYIIGSVIAAFLIIVMLVGINRAHTSSASKDSKPEKYSDSNQLAMVITGNRQDGMIPAAGITSPAGQEAVPIAIPDNPDKPPLPLRLRQAASADPEADRISQQKLQLFERAATDKTNVPFQTPEAHADGRRELTMQRIEDAKQQVAALQQQTDGNAGFKAKLAQLESGSGLVGNALGATGSQRNSLKPFDRKDDGNRWRLDSQVEAPPTPYTLRAGFIIPATLLSGINSDLPGQIIGQVNQNVYDTATGKYLLIPQGSRLVGSYASDIVYGQSRVLIVWQRIVYPDGKTLDIGAMPGADSAGYAGLSDQVNNHYLRLFGSAILMSGITAGVAYSQDRNSNSIYSQPTASSAMSEALGQQLGSVTAQMISKNLNISPTLEIRPGFRFNVMCVKDLVLSSPYQSFDY